MIGFRYPNITGSTEREQIAQIKSFLRQLVDDLNYAFTVNGDGNNGQRGLSNEQLRDQLMQEIQKLNSRINQISKEGE